MAAESQMLPLGTESPDFALPDVVTGETVKLTDLSEAAAPSFDIYDRICKLFGWPQTFLAHGWLDAAPWASSSLPCSSEE